MNGAEPKQPAPEAEQQPATPSEGTSTDTALDELLEEYADRHRRGESPTIDEYIARRPDLAADIRLLFPTMQAMEGFGRNGPGEPEGPERIGDFKILREAGRGGMGVVYEALQESLGRRVALKVLPRDLSSDAKGLERFRREARAAAKLHHTNIVPVFDVGADSGTHFYAMQFIDGRGLDSILAEARRSRREGAQRFPSLPGSSKSIQAGGRDGSGSSAAGSPERRHQRAAANVALQVADALAYAHAQGVLHRDIKPSNILIDERGTAWITDFGLAKAHDPDSKTSPDTLTQAGDIVGTIAYLAPERLEGKADERSDVYALGLTLHEMLTLEPAFQDENRRRLLRRVAEETPPSPRMLDPSIPRDLETIILKATARDPAKRYSSAARLADDLRNHLADRPIAARRASSIERLGSWCRREPRLAALSASVLFLLITIASLSSIGYLKLRESESKAIAELRRSYLAKAHTQRIVAAPGRRLDCLDSVRQAVALQPGPEEIRALRDEAIAALALVDLRVTRRWRKEPQLAFAVAPDLESFAAAEPGGDHVVLRRIGDQTEIAAIRLPGAAYGSLQYSPDGRFLVARQEGIKTRATVLDLATLEPVYTSDEMTQGNGIAFDPESRILVCVAYPTGQISRVDLADPGKVSRHPGWMGFLAVDVDATGDRIGLAARADKRIRVLDWRTGREIVSPEDNGGHTTISWSREGGMIATGCVDNSVTVWEFRDESLRKRMELERARVFVAKTIFNTRGTLLAGYSWEPLLRLWDTSSGDLLLTAEIHPLVFSKDDRRLACELGTYEAGLAEVAESEVCRVLNPPPAAQDDLIGQEVSPDGRLLVCVRRNSTVVWDLKRSRYLPRLPVNRGRSAGFSADGRWLFTGGRTGLQRWPVVRASVEDGSDSPGAAAEEGVYIGIPSTLLEVEDDTSCCLAQSADSRMIAMVGPRKGNLVYVLTADGAEYRKAVVGPHFNVNHITLTPDGKRLASSTWQGQDIKVWSTETGKLERTLPVRDNASVEFSPDGRWLAVMTPEACFLRDSATLEVAKLIPKPPQAGYPGAARFRRDGKLLAINYGRASVLLLDPATGEQIATLEAPSAVRSALAFLPDGSHLYAATLSGSVHDWDLVLLNERLRELGLEWRE